MKDRVVRAVFAAAVVAGYGAAFAGYTVNDYIKDGLIAHWDGEFNQGTDKPHDSSATTWVDLSGCGHLATATAVSGKTPIWGENCLHTANDTVKNSYYAFTPNADFLAAINADTFSYQACFKMNTFITDCGPFGCKGGGVWGMREDGSGNTYFSIKGKEAGLGNHKTQWLAGCVDSIGADGLCYSGVLNTSLGNNNSTLSPGTTPTTGNGRIGGQCANYTQNVDADIYAGRVYSRGLTGVELAYNAEIDRVRYFGDTPRTTKWVSAYSEPSNYRYGSSTPAYGTLKAVETGAAQTFTVPALTTHAFDGKRVFSVSDVTRAIYLGATLTAIAGDGTETRTDYPATIESIPDVTVDKDMFVTWKFNRQYRFKAVAMKGGTLRIGTSEVPLSAYTNWYDAAASAQVTVTAVPDEGYAFSAWSGDITMTASLSEQTVTMNQGRTLEASFVRSGKGDGSTYCWKGGAATTSWNDPDNWEGGLGPLEDDHVVITSKTAQAVLLDAATPRYKSVTIGGGDSAAITLNLQNWATAVNAETVTIGANATVRPSAAFADNENSNRVWFVCDSFTLTAGAKIDASQRGWIHRKSTMSGSGPGGGQSDRGGAGYGGIGTGGNNIWYGSAGRAYGSIEAPEQPGSSGGCDGAYANAGAGGGAVRLQVAGHAQIDGDIRADGGAAASNVGGGSGGGVYITCGTFDGTGRITAIGGVVYSTGAGGGAGGRIAIVWSDAEGQKAYSPAPVLSAGSRTYGSSSGCYPPDNRQLYSKELYHYVGKRGTVFLTDDSFHPGAIWNKCAGEFHYGTRTHDSLTIARESFVSEDSVDATKLAQDVYFAGLTVDIPDGLVLPKYAHLTLSNCTVTAKSLAVTNGCFELLGNSTLTVAGDVIAAGAGRLNFESGATNGVEAATWNEYGQKVTVAGRLLLADTAVLYPASERINGGSVAFELGSLVVESGAKIDGATRGWGKWTANSTSKNGVGPGGSSTFAGAAYGGAGGGVYRNGATYGDKKHPALPGSEGWYNSTGGYIGGYGGGLFYATVAGLVQIDGTVRMTGGNSGSTQGSAGSGGAVYIRCNRLAGEGAISADGGKGGSGTSYSGCGGGGRIAIYCNQTNNWTGVVQAKAGANSYTYKYAAEDGTVFLKVLKGLRLIVR